MKKYLNCLRRIVEYLQCSSSFLLFAKYRLLDFVYPFNGGVKFNGVLVANCVSLRFLNRCDSTGISSGIVNTDPRNQSRRILYYIFIIRNLNSILILLFNFPRFVNV